MLTRLFRYIFVNRSKLATSFVNSLKLGDDDDRVYGVRLSL
jgi:hypothetical protein